MQHHRTRFIPVVINSIDNNTNTNVANLSSSLFGEGATLIAEFWAGDGTDNTTKENTTQTTVLGYGPVIITNVTKPDTVYTNTTWMLNITATDPNNLTFTSYVQFYINDTPSGSVLSHSIDNDTSTNVANLSDSYFNKSANLIAEFWAGDGTDNTTKENTTQTTVLGYGPVIIANVTKPDTVYTNTDWLLNITATDPNNLTFTSYVQFYINDTPSGSVVSHLISNDTSTNVANLSDSYFNKSANLIAEFWAGDGTENTTKTNTTPQVTVQNLAPEQPGLTHPNNNSYINSITMNWTASSDADDDTVYYYVLVNGTQVCYTDDLNCSYSLASESYYEWNVTPYDGEENGTNSGSRYYTYDTTTPQLLNVSTDSPEYYGNDIVTFTAYASGSGIGALLIDDSSGFENCNYIVRTGCIASSNNISLSTTPQLNATMTASENTTWYAQVCYEYGFCGKIITYDFTDTSDKNAYEKLGIPSSPDDYDSEANSTDYTNIESSNNNRWVTALATEDGEFDTQIYKFNLTSQVDSLNITWEGYGEHKEDYYTNISIWNWTSSSWYELNNKDFTSSADDTLNGTINSGVDDFVNTTTKQVVMMVTSKKLKLSFSSVSVGDYHTCGVLVNGRVMCWGTNEYGQLGIGSFDDKTPYPNPLYVNSNKNFTSVSCGVYHTCGRLVNGSLMCWGRSNYGQIGYGSTGDKSSPYPVNSNENFTSVSAGYEHTCGRLVDGSLMCWGYGNSGQLGYGDTDNKYSPYPVNSNENFTSVSAGYEHTCGVLINGSLMCWGRNDDGQTGDGYIGGPLHNPVYVKSSENFTSVSAGGGFYQSHTCGRLVNGSLMCWGRNNRGQLGIGNFTTMSVPTRVNSNENFTSVSAGKDYTCGVLINGSLMCWGKGDYGQLGYGGTDNKYSPYPVNSNENFTSVSAAGGVNILGGAHTCGRLVDGSLMCWGYNEYGQIGDGTSSIITSPVDVDSSENFISVDVGNDYTCGVLINGSLMCWGDNYFGQLGYGGTDNKYSPYPVNSNENFTSVDAGYGYSHTCGRLVNGSLMCWGYGSSGRLGDGTIISRHSPVDVNSSENFTSVSVGYSHTCGSLVNGSVMCWGYGANGRLGIGNTTEMHVPTMINSDKNFTSVSAGYAHTCGVLVNGSVMCWGYGNSGQLGHGSTTDKYSPYPVNSNENFTSVSAGRYHTCGRLVNGSLMCWGSNVYGQIGDGTTTAARYSPVDVDSSENFTSVEVGEYHTCGRMVNGSLMCWGRNVEGQIGDGTTTQRNSPVYVNSSENFTSVSAGTRHTCGKLIDGSLMCWGWNMRGGVGNGDMGYRVNPVYVMYSFSPFLYAYKDGKYGFVSDFIAGATSQDKEYTSFSDITDKFDVVDGKVKLKITEEMDETAYIDRVYLRVDSGLESEKIVELGSITNADIELLKYSDDNYLVIEQGEEYYLEFDSPEAYNKIEFAAEGYYIQHSDYSGMQEGIESFSSVPKPVSYNPQISHNSVHTDYVKLEFPAMGFFSISYIPPELLNVSTDSSEYNGGDTVTFTAYAKGTETGALLIDDSSGFENCNYSVKTGCIANSNNLNLTQSPQQLTATMTASSNITWYAQVCDDNGGCDSIINYDFSDTSNKNAYEKLGIPSSPDDYDSEATSADYENIKSSNDNRWITELATADGDFDTQIYKFNLSENTSQISSLNITWEGYGETESGYYTDISIWNWTSGSWYELDNKDFTSLADNTLNRTISSGISDFVNSTTNQVVIMVTSKKFTPITFSSVSAGGAHTCGRLVNGSLMCWGRNNYGQLGNGTGGSGQEAHNPIYVNSSEIFTSVSGVLSHTCGRLVNGSLMCWGLGTSGQLGNGDNSNQNNPVNVNSSENFTSVSAGQYHTCGVLVNGSAMCWGRNYNGQLGNGTGGIGNESHNPIYVNSNENFTSVSAGGAHTCGRLVNGDVMCWGYNRFGQLGIGSSDENPHPNPLYVNSNENFTSVDTGGSHTCGRLINGSLMCWGLGSGGRLGNGDTSQQNSPVNVNSSENFTSVSAGQEHTCGRLVNGSLMCWGWNLYGQLGDGTAPTDQHNPVYVNSSENFTSVSTGGIHACGRLVNGSLMCWGRNDYGAIGDGTSGNERHNPVYVVNTYSPFLYVFRDGKYEFVSDFIAGATSSEMEYTSFVDITDKVEIVEGKVKLKITEEMDETAYIDMVYLRIDSGLENERIIELDSLSGVDIELLRESDDRYLVIEQGEEHYLEFNAPESCDKIEFASEGYYIQHSDYSGMQEGIESFSSVPKPVSYNPQISHNSVHTDYVKLEFPAMGYFGVNVSNIVPTIIANVTKPDPVYMDTDWMLNLTITDPDEDDNLTAYTQFYINRISSGLVHNLNVTNGTNTNVANLSNLDFVKGDTLIAENKARHCLHKHHMDV